MFIQTRAVAAVLLAGALALSGCATNATDTAASAAASQVTSTSLPSSSATGAQPPPPGLGRLLDGTTVATQDKVVSGLEAPWDIEPMSDGSLLISERDTGSVKRVRSGFATSLNGPGADTLRNSVVSGGEGGLLGLAISPSNPTLVYAYISRTDGNSVVRMSLSGDLLSPPVDVLTGIPHAANHNGGRIAFGPDGYLYITTGDSGERSLAQDKDSLAGKILRVTADGSEDDGDPAPGNPFDSPVWSLGHRNVEGLGWTADGRMYATEFGQDSMDELNLIEPGANYGWPTVEGLDRAPAGTTLGETVDGLTYPVAQWPVADASPSGLAITDQAIYVAALRGEDVLRVPLTPTGIGTPTRLELSLGRIRDVEVQDGTLLVVTNNTDGRGDPREGDDHLYRLTLS